MNRFSFQEHSFSTTIGEEMVYGLPSLPRTDLLDATAAPYERKLSSILLDYGLPISSRAGDAQYVQVQLS